MKTPRCLAAFLLSISVAVAAPAQAPTRRRVVFVCEHGSVKSLMAREWFDRMAAERGLDVRAVSRGMTPDPAVPPAIAKALQEDGFDVTGFEPRAFSEADAKGALRVVGIGVDLARSPARSGARLETWEGIPPTSEGYAVTREALRARISDLLKTLEGATRRP